MDAQSSEKLGTCVSDRVALSSWVLFLFGLTRHRDLQATRSFKPPRGENSNVVICT